MKLFSCPSCERVLFFDNTVCTNCGQHVGYSVEARALVAVPVDAEKTREPFLASASGKRAARYTKCKNFAELETCNWLVLSSDHQEYCRSCRLTETVPDLSNAENRTALVEIERAKRRLVYSLLALGLPVVSKKDDPQGGLRFDFLRGTDEKPVMTGHDEGLITLNVAEANAAFRENMREKMGEQYRTVLGHMRHESGHYYWDRLIRGSTRELAGFRKLFGNDELSYDDAIKRHYDQGPPANWSESFISEYATMHPWEDWAETWAHYLHMIDTLETAKNHGLTVRIPGKKTGTMVAIGALAFRDYESLSTGWQAVTIALNEMNRSMGMKDIYPFVVSPTVHEKIRFVHDLTRRTAQQNAGGTLLRYIRVGYDRLRYRRAG